ncbi:SAC3 domain-containing protein 1-like [Amphiura filiformis]|uniref:SAC3 domain-containing protein 1-like n=1 Tax=Amphiura filiformis TaxID=82378 RepID=UPI003B213904
MQEDIWMRGTCIDMCPFRERRMREQQHRLHPLEMVAGTEKNKRPKADPKATIKEYSRPAAGKAEASPADLRPAEVLLTTVEYLVNRILTRPDWPFVKLYNFVFDRLRSVRQDMVIQRLTGKDALQILQWITKFHIYAGYRLCTEAPSSYDSKINADHAQECIKRLLVFYRTCEDLEHPCRPEFESLYLLYNLGSFEAARHTVNLPKHIQCQPCVQLAIAICRAFWEGNFIRLWRLASQCTYIQSCALHRHVIDIRWRALCILNTAYSSKNLTFPIPVLTRWLMFDSEADTIEFCHTCGLDAGPSGVKFVKGCLQNGLPKIHASHSVSLVDNKLEEEGISSVSDVIMGFTLDR